MRGKLRLATQVIRAIFSMGPLGWGLIIAGGIFLYIIIFSGASPMGGGAGSGTDKSEQSNQPGGKKYPPIPGFSRAIDGPEASENGKDITYTIRYEYDSTIATTPLENIVLIANYSSNASLVEASGSHTSPAGGSVEWPLSDGKNTSPITLVLRPNVPDTYVNVSLGQRTNNSSGGASSGNACTARYEGRGYCTVGNLAGKFGGEGNTALVASMICQQESTSDPFARNLKCPPDYSIGLFQINQLAHCSSAFSSTSSCSIGNQPLLSACVTRFEDPIENINYAYQVYNSGGTGWTVNKWGAYEVVQKKLAECGIL